MSGQHRESLGLLRCAGQNIGVEKVCRDRGDVRIPVLASSSFLKQPRLASVSYTVLAVAAMPTVAVASDVLFTARSFLQS